MSVRPPYEAASVPTIAAMTLTVYAAANGSPARAQSDAVSTIVSAATETSTNADESAVCALFFSPVITPPCSAPKHFYFITKERISQMGIRRSTANVHAMTVKKSPQMRGDEMTLSNYST